MEALTVLCARNTHQGQVLVRASYHWTQTSEEMVFETTINCPNSSPPSTSSSLPKTSSHATSSPRTSASPSTRTSALYKSTYPTTCHTTNIPVLHPTKSSSTPPSANMPDPSPSTAGSPPADSPTNSKCCTATTRVSCASQTAHGETCTSSILRRPSSWKYIAAVAQWWTARRKVF